jgi:hypothetical protein
MGSEIQLAAMSNSEGTLDLRAAFAGSALRVVLFGLPDAGKSSLLGALAQVAQAQEHALGGRLTDASHRLAELQERVYDGSLQKTVDEVVPYRVFFEPLPTHEHHTHESRTEAVLVDCDGRVAEELLARRRPFHTERGDSSLARAASKADVLLFVVDASADAMHLDASFGEFSRFLHVQEQGRGWRSEVGGLPVFLVLTKCDLLAQPVDTSAAWSKRIQERKRQVHMHFEHFLQRQKPEGRVPFGRLDLYVAATAVKRPMLADLPAKPGEPYGVAELFRQAFECASAFRQRRARSRHRLIWAVACCTGLSAALVALVTFLLFSRPPEVPDARELLAKVESYRLREAQTPSLRLREPLQPKISELTDLKNDHDFSRLPQEKRDYVMIHLQELQEYRTYKENVEHIATLSTVRSERELNEIERDLQEVGVPAKHQLEWSQTDAALRRAERLAEIKAVRKSSAGFADWYAQLFRKGEEALTPPKDGPRLSWPDWHDRVRTLLQEAEGPPQRPGEKWVGTKEAYEVALRLDKPAAARDAWETLRHRLERVRDLSSALGLANAAPAPLDILPGFKAAQAAGRLQELEKAFPRFQEEFVVTDLPEAIAGEVRRAALPRYENVLKAGREVVLRHLQQLYRDGPESADAWRKLRPWLAAPEELQAWRVLATVLDRLQSVDPADPVTALDTFLGRDRFELALRRLVLQIPDDTKIQPAGKLLIHHRSGLGNRPALTYEVAEMEQADVPHPVTRYTLRPLGDASLTYQPGDTLWAELPVKSADSSDQVLTWARNRSQVYQFERLVRPPRLHRKGQDNTQGDVLAGVSLEITPADGLPRVPDLMPVVPVEAGKR